MLVQHEGERVKQSIIGIVCLLCFGMFIVGGGSESDASAWARLDPALRMLVSDVSREPAVTVPSHFDPTRYDVRTSEEIGEQRIGVLVKLARPRYGGDVAGIPILGSTGTILTLDVSTAELIQLLDDPDVDYVEPVWRASKSLDASVPAIGADQVHGLSSQIRGEGVVVGIVDTGIDYLHLDFREDTDGDGFEESSRILALWDQSFGMFGIRYSKEEIEDDIANGHGSSAGTVRQADVDGHGTHVAGIAAGDGSSSIEGFVGVAPDATLVVVKTTFYTSEILSGVEYIFDMADAYGMPAVVNLSLGGHDGPHDGTSLFEQGLDELAASAAGRAIVVSAGNEGDQAIHAGKTLSGGAASYGIDLDASTVDLSVWYPGGSRFNVTITPPSGDAIVVPWGTETGPLTTASGTVRVDNAWAGVNPNNGDNEAYIRMYGVTSFAGWEIEIRDVQGGGRFDLWVTSGTATLVGGDSNHTIDEPGNADEVITVGAYTTKTSWPSQSGEQDWSDRYTLGEIAPFSSRGPTRDGRTKPDLAAPGAWICAALSSDQGWQSAFVHPDGLHTVEGGTSMAAPHVAGTIALMLSEDPELTVAEIRSTLQSTAERDGQTGGTPNLSWGYGKVDAAAAVDAIASAGPEPPPSTDEPTIVLGENPVVVSARFAYTVPEGTTSATLRIYDVAGGLVYGVPVSPGGGTVTWNLRTDRGDSVASGLYLYVLTTDRGVSEVGRLVIAR